MGQGWLILAEPVTTPTLVVGAEVVRAASRALDASLVETPAFASVVQV